MIELKGILSFMAKGHVKLEGQEASPALGRAFEAAVEQLSTQSESVGTGKVKQPRELGVLMLRPAILEDDLDLAAQGTPDLEADENPAPFTVLAGSLDQKSLLDVASSLDSALETAALTLPSDDIKGAPNLSRFDLSSNVELPKQQGVSGAILSSQVSTENNTTQLAALPARFEASSAPSSAFAASQSKLDASPRVERFGLERNTSTVLPQAVGAQLGENLTEKVVSKDAVSVVSQPLSRPTDASTEQGVLLRPERREGAPRGDIRLATAVKGTRPESSLERLQTEAPGAAKVDVQQVRAERNQSFVAAAPVPDFPKGIASTVIPEDNSQLKATPSRPDGRLEVRLPNAEGRVLDNDPIAKTAKAIEHALVPLVSTSEATQEATGLHDTAAGDKRSSPDAQKRLDTYYSVPANPTTSERPVQGTPLMNSDGSEAKLMESDQVTATRIRPTMPVATDEMPVSVARKTSGQVPPVGRNQDLLVSGVSGYTVSRMIGPAASDGAQVENFEPQNSSTKLEPTMTPIANTSVPPVQNTPLAQHLPTNGPSLRNKMDMETRVPETRAQPLAEGAANAKSDAWYDVRSGASIQSQSRSEAIMGWSAAERQITAQAATNRGREAFQSDESFMMAAQSALEAVPQSARGIEALARTPPAAVPQEVLKIAEQLRAGARMDRYPVEIALDPPELGQVRMMLQTGETSTTLIILADRPETAELMRRHAQFLHDAFAQEGQGGLNLQFGASDQGDSASSGTGGRRNSADSSGGMTQEMGVQQTAMPATQRASTGTSSGLNITF